VWAPRGPGPHPVFVWFYGGGFLTGSTADPTIDGSRLAARGPMVVVTVAYRLGALGYLAVGDTNCGLRDQMCGLDWVHENIASFGGDPDNVTVAGESAGGGSALHLLAAGAAPDRFHHVIAQSGATDKTRSRAEVDRVTEVVVGALDGDDPYAVPWARVIEAQGKTIIPLLMEMARMPFHPCVDDDVLAAKPVDALAAGVGAEVDLLIGTTRDEMRLFLMEATLADAQMRKRVDRYLGSDGSAIVRTYQQFVGEDPMDVWAAIFSDREMLLPAVAMAGAHQGRTFRSLFTWEVAPRGDGLPLRACHAADLPFTFDSLDRLGWDGWTGTDRAPEAGAALVNAMTGAWCAFAGNGDPGWPEVGSGRVMEFGAECGGRADPMAERLAVWQ
jgi:para-nitrobenzyl esterase